MPISYINLIHHKALILLHIMDTAIMFSGVINLS